ncbi:hypothetical protein E3N88_07579 [Mikania micrantha]|uniref:Reverse transcriptase zinc-binding domain-containing protein n=1 Tax=Mikania micrantha TaxID=192012 RepID=A0A5N6PRX7_9ASTR|nr:hypothetical protein E3N88_07579 [Mikania micrantha]
MTNLISRGINVQSPSCPLCLMEDEHGEHLLFRCIIAQERGGLRRKIQMLLAASTMWSLWLSRNNWCFQRVRRSIDCLVEDIKLQSFTWVEQRGKKISIVWEKWIVNPWEGISKI